MKRLFVIVAIAAVAGILATSGCTQAAPAAPTQAPPAPTKAAAPAAPTAAPAAATAAPTKAPQPTAAPTAAPKVSWPEPGKTITVVVPFTAGGVADNSLRVLAPIMEKDLGVPIQIVNKGGASTMIGMTDVFRSKPDGYTLGVGSLPSTVVTYLDPDMKAPYTKKDFQTIGLFVVDVITVAVNPETPFKALKDLADAGKANPGKLKMSTTGLLAVTHLAAIAFEQATGAKFSYVHFPGGAEANAAVIGGHVDGQFNVVGNTGRYHKGGQMRVLAIMDKDQSSFIPDVKTVDALGYPKLYANVGYGLVAPTGTPKEVIQVLEASAKKAAATAEYKEKIAGIQMIPRFMDSAEFNKFWDEIDVWAAPLVKAGKTQQ